MIRGLWISASALDPAVRAQEILANNLANLGSTGFRQDRFAFHRIAQERAQGAPQANLAAAEGIIGGGTSASTAGGNAGAPPAALPIAPTAQTRLDLKEGTFETTGDPFHLALAGPGFFAVQGPEGELFTRDGALRRSTDGTLLHRSGYPILSEGGTITVPATAQLVVGADGTVFVDGAPQGKLRLASLPDPSALHHVGQNLLRADQPAETETTSRVLQGSLEGSNVDPVGSMVEMMLLLRAFEANQRALQTQDATLGRLLQWAAG